MSQVASFITTSALAASALFSYSSSFIAPTNAQHYQPLIAKVNLSESTSTPKIKELELSWPQEAQSFFPKISGYTKEEAKIYNDVINELFVPTGRNLFEL
jgi:outer membrane cobalamin receptor